MQKNDEAWEILFARYDILEHIHRHGVYEISAAQINAEREARLMTKFDHKIQLPALFRKHHLTIQPNSRGTYVIGNFVSYRDLPKDDTPPEIIEFPSHIKTIQPDRLFSESTSLLCAYHSGMIAKLLGEDVALTVFGRMSTGRFRYVIDNNQGNIRHEISVENSQCEIDSGFEGQSQFALVEAKNEEVMDFLIRQLYYPYRLWKSKLLKRVIPVFLCVSGGIFSFYVFRFAEESHYNSIELVTQKKYQIGTLDISREDLIRLLRATPVLPEPERIPFPQADSFNRLVDLLGRLYASTAPLSQEEITTNYAFDIRQTQYYTQAGAYLGLIERRHSSEQGVTYALTGKGTEFMTKSVRARNLALAQCVMQHQVFHTLLEQYLDTGARPTQKQAEAVMRDARLEGMDSEHSTIPRRAQTVLSWLDWIIGLTQRH